MKIYSEHMFSENNREYRAGRCFALSMCYLHRLKKRCTKGLSRSKRFALAPAIAPAKSVTSLGRK